ncbi:PEP-CTERM sorting domain-containing protein [Alteromonas sp. C1M14]|uniref:PEP-CTERM sorting domain-containing protein n=1 Tax=Alteromonas sp. C1M14 TaxID=2841567 RepID=UPI001C083F89|nr:PEP-CTERM sorting domain-containing protein [Alteromonas sp. C1M14]MBU2977267.1 PEP-CTERM sorting domain-containing protein [Alteromonas sp. C1M14]
MKHLFFLAAMFVTVSANADIYTLDLTNDNSGSVSSSDGWLTDNTAAVDFYTFELTADTDIAFSVSAVASIGLSLYQGTLSSDPSFLFSHNNDFIDFMGNSYAYLVGTDGYVPNAGDNTLAAGLLGAGEYTLALGGNEGFDFGAIEYVLTSTVTGTEVPEPSTFALVMMMLGAMAWRYSAAKR